MRAALSRAQMRDFDKHVIEVCHVPGIVLMENAGRGAADVIEREALRGRTRGARVVVVCGNGNNGGDGYVVGRHLRARGADVAIFCTDDPGRLKGDARKSYEAFVGVGGSVRTIADESVRDDLRQTIARADVVVDALFGTGLDRPIVGGLLDVLATMSRATASRIAIDVPSGMDADTGGTLGGAFRADLTVTFAHPKIGLMTPRGAILSGALHVVDLGVPALLGPALSPAGEILEAADIARLLPPRAKDDQKYKAGSVAVFAGAGGKTGAALMVARAALRAGAGLATIATWEESAEIVRGRVTEEMVTALARGAGMEASVDLALDRKKAIVVGPGFGTDADARAAVSALFDRWKGPAIYDADALTLFAGEPEAFARTAIPCVLTPHAGEAARLLGTTSEAVDGDRFAAARSLATRARGVVVLKGAYTLIAEPGGRVAVNPSACPALATAGSGDTLAGLVGALLCGLSPFEAACAGVFIHAAAAERWSAAHGDRGLLASEIADGVPDVLRALSLEHTGGPH